MSSLYTVKYWTPPSISPPPTHSCSYHHHMCKKLPPPHRPPPHSASCSVQIQYLCHWLEGKTPPVQVAEGDTTMCACGYLCQWLNENTPPVQVAMGETMPTSGVFVPKVRVQGARVRTSIHASWSRIYSKCNSNHNQDGAAQDQHGCPLEWMPVEVHDAESLQIVSHSELH